MSGSARPAIHRISAVFIRYDLPTEVRRLGLYMKILIAAAIENKLSSDYVEFLKSKKSVYYPVLSEIFAIRVYFWVRSRAR